MAEVYTPLKKRVEEAVLEAKEKISNMTYLVEVGYFEFKFESYVDASMFMSLAKKGITEDKRIRMTVTYKEDEDE